MSAKTASQPCQSRRMSVLAEGSCHTLPKPTIETHRAQALDAGGLLDVVAAGRVNWNAGGVVPDLLLVTDRAVGCNRE